MYELKSVGILRCGLVLAVLYAIFGFLEALFVAPLTALTPNATMNPFAALGWVALIVFPIIGAIGGLIGGVIAAAIYNLVAKWTGGLQLRLAVEPGAEAFNAS